MLQDYKKNANTTKMIDRFDWIIIPVSNPDGYAFTFAEVCSQVIVRYSPDEHDVFYLNF